VLKSLVLWAGVLYWEHNQMKTIGLIGGMSWESSIEYYRIVNQKTREILGGLHSAKSLMYSVDFAEIESLQSLGKWDDASRIMIDAAQRLERAGADFIVICTNTMHKAAEDFRGHVRIPLLHIADATAKSVLSGGIRKVALLGTRFTMEEDFYKGKLVRDHQLDVIVPPPDDMEIVHRIIYDELCAGKIIPSSKMQYMKIMESLVDRGAEGIILGCTEIGLLVQQGDCRVPLFDTTTIHAEAAVAYAIAD
jgi:amino-acid racemase